MREEGGRWEREGVEGWDEEAGGRGDGEREEVEDVEEEEEEEVGRSVAEK